MSLSEQFQQASADINSLDQKPSNELLLKLYALYKQGSEGDVTGDPPSNPVDFVAKAKYNARVELQGRSKESAMQSYIALVKELSGEN